MTMGTPIEYTTHPTRRSNLFTVVQCMAVVLFLTTSCYGSYYCEAFMIPTTTTTIVSSRASTTGTASRISSVSTAQLGRSSSFSLLSSPYPSHPRTHVSFPPAASASALNLSIDDAITATSSLFTTTSIVPLLPSFTINAILFTLLKSKLNKMLTPEGYFHSLALGTMLWHTLGWKGWTTCVLYLFLGSLVTKVKFQEKAEMGIAEGRGGRRGPENVWGSAATGLLCAAASLQIHPSIVTTTTTSTSSFLGISYDLLLLGYVSSLATKLADTFASEIGKAYGKTTFLITTFERVEPGTEGAVSAEGTAAAAFGGLLLPLYAFSIGLIHDWTSVGIATFAAFLATNAESLIGAVLQGKKGFEWMTNEVVNFINTVIGAGIAISLGKLMFFVL